MARMSIKDVIVGILIGFVLVLGSFPLLIWNEYRSVKTAQALDEGADAVISVDSDEIDSDNDGELVHLTDTVETDDVLGDPKFPVEEEAIGFRRTVEMYQWHEEEETTGSGDNQRKEYNYYTDWSRSEVDSNRFHRTSGHQNPTSMPFDQHTDRATHVTMGAFELSSTFIDEVSNFTPVPLDDDIVEKASGLHDGPMQLDGDRLYLGENPSNPQVGDVRITFSTINPHTVSAIGAQEGTMLASYATDAGRNLNLLYEGQMSADEMFEQAHAENVALTWGIRFGGTMAMFIGFVLIFGPISFVARFIPIVGDLIIGAKKLVAAGLTFFLAGGTIATGWLFARPLIGIPLCMFVFAAGVGFFGLAFVVVKNRSDGDDELEPVDGTV